MIGLGASHSKGNLALMESESTNSGTGAYVEYRYKQMIEKDSWNNILTRSGYGVDYNFNLRGNNSEFNEAFDRVHFKMSV